MVLTIEDVHAAYEAILGRGPENDDVVALHQAQHDSSANLHAAMMASAEFDEADYIRRKKLDARTTVKIDELDELAGAFLIGKTQLFAGKSLELPVWFDIALPPRSAAYQAQMLLLWSAITSRDAYSPEADEDTPEVARQDFIKRPAFYATEDTAIAGGHLMAIGHILTRSELPRHGRVLEYGAGFAQTALTFARLGAAVDTVDINPAFCRGVRKLGRHFGVDLKAYYGQFGFNPAGEDEAYDLILFYESFHHCLDADALIEKLVRMLKPNGTIILGGEPIFRTGSPDMPYDWGFRLDWENVAIMRIRGWMELGYNEKYLLDLFKNHGLSGEFFEDANSHWAQVYRFRASE